MSFLQRSVGKVPAYRNVGVGCCGQRRQDQVNVIARRVWPSTNLQVSDYPMAASTKNWPYHEFFQHFSEVKSVIFKIVSSEFGDCHQKCSWHLGPIRSQIILVCQGYVHKNAVDGFGMAFTLISLTLKQMSGPPPPNFLASSGMALEKARTLSHHNAREWTGALSQRAELRST